MLSSLYLVHTQNTIFDSVDFQQRYRENPFALGDAYLTPFCQRMQVALRTTHRQNIMRKCDTEGFYVLQV